MEKRRSSQQLYQTIIFLNVAQKLKSVLGQCLNDLYGVVQASQIHFLQPNYYYKHWSFYEVFSHSPKYQTQLKNEATSNHQKHQDTTHIIVYALQLTTPLDSITPSCKLHLPVIGTVSTPNSTQLEFAFDSSLVFLFFMPYSNYQKLSSIRMIMSSNMYCNKLGQPSALIFFQITIQIIWHAAIVLTSFLEIAYLIEEDATKMMPNFEQCL